MILDLGATKKPSDVAPTLRRAALEYYTRSANMGGRWADNRLGRQWAMIAFDFELLASHLEKRYGK